MPARICSAPSITAFSAEPHILFTVVAGTDTGTPAPTAAWRAGAWPSPAGSTHPRMTSSRSAPLMPADSRAARTAALPSCTAVSGASAPRNAPIGVRLAETMTTSWLGMGVSFQVGGRRAQRARAGAVRRARRRGGTRAAATAASVPLPRGESPASNTRTNASAICAPLRD